MKKKWSTLRSQKQGFRGATACGRQGSDKFLVTPHNYIFSSRFFPIESNSLSKKIPTWHFLIVIFQNTEIHTVNPLKFRNLLYGFQFFEKSLKGSAKWGFFWIGNVILQGKTYMKICSYGVLLKISLNPTYHKLCESTRCACLRWLRRFVYKQIPVKIENCFSIFKAKIAGE